MRIKFATVALPISLLALFSTACGPSDESTEPATEIPPGGECFPQETSACYTGPAGTAGVGPCLSGMRTCTEEGVWQNCSDEVTPSAESCGNSVDDDCDGVVDGGDADNDGFDSCGGDCCDSSALCGSPELVNPGAYDVVGNNVDDDCDGTVDNAAVSCDNALLSNSTDAMAYAAAMDLCQTTTEAGEGWGLISATLTLPDGSGTPHAGGQSIRPTFGTNTPARLGSAMAVFSTGIAAVPGDANPSFVPYQPGHAGNTVSDFPADWLTANGGGLPNVMGCPPPAGNARAVDSAMLTLRLRVPTNANSFSIASNFYSSEFPEWVCSPYNDFFVALLKSGFAGTPANPIDGNLAKYTDPASMEYPVGVNLAFGDTGLFSQCLNGPTGCGDEAISGNTGACMVTDGLAGTGYDLVGVDDGPLPGGCAANNLVGGATGWLVTSGNVVPGEVIELRLAIWDTSDPFVDSTVLLDEFQWSLEMTDPGTVID